MQQATATIVNDIGLLKAEHIPQFRSFLESKGVQVRDAGTGQFCHIRMPNLPRWMPIERGRGGAPVTPTALRSLMDEFLLCDGVKEANQNFQILPVDAVPVAREAEQSAVTSLQGVAFMPPLAERPAPLSRYLNDLRDDLALHAPLVQLANETVRSFAIRRWEYADLMLATRTTTAGD